jgi:galactose mutarotase-like enzyme
MMDTRVLSLISPSLTLQVTPSEGGRITSLVNRSTNTEWLFKGVTCPPLREGSCFDEGPRGGFDECLPSVAPSPALGWPGDAVGDHGDLWWRPWTVVEATDEHLVLQAGFANYPLTLVRSIEVLTDAPVVRLEYEIRNKSDRPLPYLYSAHPLFALDETMSVEIATGQLVLNAFGQGLDPQARSHWPWVRTGAGIERIDHIEPEGAVANYKVFVTSTGTVTLRRTASGESLQFLYDASALPWIGLCVNRWGWPHEGALDRWVAIEPTTAPTDELSRAVEAGWARTLAPGDAHQWTFDMVLRYQLDERDATGDDNA